MVRHPLEVLRRLRSIALDQARRALADRLREEAAAAEQSATIAATIARETAVHAGEPVEHRTVETYAAWLGRAQVAQREAEAARWACVAATVEARGSLNDARAGTRALEAAVAQMLEVQADAAARLEQQAVDEAAAGCKRPERWSG